MMFMLNGKNGTLKFSMTTKSDRTQNILNFIGIYDNYITDEMCNQVIDLFKKQNSFKKTISRKAFENASSLDKSDEQYFANADNINIWYTELKPLLVNFEMAFKHYETETGVLKAYGINDFHFTTLKIQKTLPTQGYHVWHIEHGLGYINESRALAFGIYLNDVEEGGETEFLHFSKRVKPKAGRIVIWPAGFPYVHRGNPPLTGNKYLLTSWMLLR